VTVRRNRASARVNRTTPIAARAAKSRHTTSSPAPRNRIAWAKLIKWVVGENGTNFWSHSGMLSTGVVPPDRRRSPERYDHPTQREPLGGQSPLDLITDDQTRDERGGDDPTGTPAVGPREMRLGLPGIARRPQRLGEARQGQS
jgi:hypothetical protein